MSEQGNIPTLTDLIEKGIEIKMSDLGLDDELRLGVNDADAEDEKIDITEPDLDRTEPEFAIDPFENNPALEQNLRRILDEHMELALQEIIIAIRQDIKKP